MLQTGGTFRCEKPPIFKALFRKELAWVLLFSVFFLSSKVNAQEPTCDEVPLTLDVDGIGSMELFSLLCGEEVYVSVPDLFDFLKIRNVSGKNYDSVTGYVLNQNDTFVIDALENTVVYGGETIELSEGDIRASATNLYLKAHYFGEIFGLGISSSIRSMSIDVVPSFELPSLRAARREKLRENVQRLKRGTIAADTSIAREKPFFNMGVADWNLYSSQSTEGRNYNRFNLGLGGLLAGGEFTSRLNYNSNQPFSSRNQFYKWRYVDNEHEVVRQTSIGRINPRSTSTIYDPVVGIQLTNAPTYLKKSFGTYQLSDYTEPDWMVELYINNVLVDFVQADASGFFSFDVPLMYGSTAIELRYYGPYGEEEIVDQHFSIPFVFLPKNEFEYTVSAGVVEDGENSVFAQAVMNYGLTESISLGGGVEYLSSLEAHPVMPFVNAAVRLPSNMLLSGQYTHQVGFEGDFSYTSPSNVRLELRYAKYHEEQQAVRFSYLEERELELSVPVRLGGFRGTSRLSLRQNMMRSGSYFQPQWFLSARAFGLNFNLSTNGYFNEFSDPLVYSRLSSSIRLPRGVTFTPQVQYEYGRNQLASLRGELRKRVFRSSYVRTSYEHNFKMDQFYLNVGLTFELGFSRVGLSSTASSNESTLTETASGSLLFDPKLGHFETSNRTSLDRANVEFIAFLDVNGNGQRDAMERQLEGMEVRSLNGGQREVTRDGATLFSNLEPYVDHHFTINTDRLNRIAWRVKNKTLNVALNPNQIKLVEIPVSVEGEVGGFVYDAEGNGFGGIRINILDGEGALVKQLISEPDGFFSYLGLKSGGYMAQLDSAQLENLELGSNGPISFEIRNTEEGDLVDNLEFVVQPKTAGNGRQEELEVPVSEEKESLSRMDEQLPITEEVEKRSEVAFVPSEKTGNACELTFRVQVAASNVRLSENHQPLQGKEGLEMHVHQGQYKYTFGETNSLTEALQLQEQLQTEGFMDAFVVAFKGGDRLSSAEFQKLDCLDGAASPGSKENSTLDLAEEDFKEKVDRRNSAPSEKDSTACNLTFRVQVAASNVPLSINHPALRGKEGLEMHLHQGQYKYTFGTIGSLSEALEIQEELQAEGFSDAFVVAFNEEVRLSPEEFEARDCMEGEE